MVCAVVYRGYAICNANAKFIINQINGRCRGVWHTPEKGGFYNVAATVCGIFYAAAYRAYAIRPYNYCKTSIAKITFDAGKTMSYVEKIMSDIIKTTSDLFLHVSKPLKNNNL